MNPIINNDPNAIKEHMYITAEEAASYSSPSHGNNFIPNPAFDISANINGSIHIGENIGENIGVEYSNGNLGTNNYNNGNISSNPSSSFHSNGNLGTSSYNNSNISSNYTGGYSFYSTTPLTNQLNSMTNTIENISKIYSKINIESDDILLTMVDTGETLSINEVITEWRELKKEKENVVVNPEDPDINIGVEI